MAWTASKVFTTFVTDLVNNTTAMDLNTDALLEVGLFNTTITPDNTVTSANSAWAVAVWVVGGAITDTGTSAPAGWPQLGRPLASVTSTFSTTTYTFTAAATVSANATTTLAATGGCLIYDHSAGTVTDQGICYINFGGSQTVTLGTFTIAWNGSGIFTISTA
jgi:hypothetical protein